MICCLNPDCQHPINPDGNQYCQSCSAPLTPLLRGHYRVTEVLSDEGGFGRTYLAHDVDKLNENCVVKQLAPKVQGTWALNKAIELFKEEAKRLQELGQHPQIPTLLAYFEYDGYLYLVQEFIEGENLFRELQKYGCFDEAKIHQVLIDVLPLLKFIHDRGVIHRDIKPQNIMRRSLQVNISRGSKPPGQAYGRYSLVNNQANNSSELVLIDFGASKQLTATVQTKPGTTIGSFGYSPIEQINGGEAYPSSDLFSLGATCFHLMSGISPFQLWAEYGYGWVHNWRNYLKYPVSQEFGDILDKLLKKDIQERYVCSDEVLDDLENIAISPQATPQLPLPSASIPSLSQSSQNRLKLFSFPFNGQLQQLNFIQSLGQHQLIQTLIISGLVILVSVIGSQIYGYMRYRVFPSPPSFLIRSLPSSMFLQQTLSTGSGGVMSVAISGDANILASANRDRNIMLWNLDTGQRMQAFPGHDQTINHISFSPDGKTLASASSDQTVKLWNPITGRELRVFRGHTGTVSDVAFSPDNRVLASTSYDTTIKLWNLSTGEEIRTFHGHTDRVLSIAFSPDGKIFATSSSDRTIKLWNPFTGEEIRTLRGHGDNVMHVAFSPDGKTLASASSDNTVKIWNIANGTEIRTLTGHQGTVWSVVYSMNATMLASGGSDDSIKLWNPFNGEEIRTLTGHTDRVDAIAFSPDGKILASGSKDGTIKIWRVSP